MADYRITSSSLTNSWAAYLSILGQGLIYGGPQGVIFSLLVAAFMQWTITLGLSELASAFPSLGVSLAT
jgi:choline transport protein